MKITDTMRIEAGKLGLRILTEDERKRRERMGRGKGYVWNADKWNWDLFFNRSDAKIYALPVDDLFFAPEIRVLTLEECERLKNSDRWKDVYIRSLSDEWVPYHDTFIPHPYMMHKVAQSKRYGLPDTDPFFAEHHKGESCELPHPYHKGFTFQYTGEKRVATNEPYIGGVNNICWFPKHGKDDPTIEPVWILRAIPIEQKSKPKQVTWDELAAQVEKMEKNGEFDPLVGKRVWWDGLVHQDGTDPTSPVVDKLEPKYVVVRAVFHAHGGEFIYVENMSWALHRSQFTFPHNPKPLVKVWAIDSEGNENPYQFRGEPNWKRIEGENDGAEAIVVWSEGEYITPLGSTNYIRKYQVVKGNEYVSNHIWHGGNPVPAIVAAIKARKLENIIPVSDEQKDWLHRNSMFVWDGAETYHCTADGTWYKIRRYGGYWDFDTDGLPANHPFWDKWKEMKAEESKYKVGDSVRYCCGIIPATIVSLDVNRCEIKFPDGSTHIAPMCEIEPYSKVLKNAPLHKKGKWVFQVYSTPIAVPYQLESDSDDVMLRDATRSDFEVKRNGHTWLAVECKNTSGIDIFCDGFQISYFDNDDITFKTFINLPVCPAGIK